MTDVAGVLAALDGVIDPELDEPVTELGFVAACDVSDAGDVAVRLRLPTHQCAPNFAYLMVADARAAIAPLEGVRSVEVELCDHMTAHEINGAVRRGEGFSGAFPGETAGELDELRTLFRRKALVARQSRLAEALGRDDLSALTVADLPATRDAARCLELRALLGLATDAGAAAFVRPDGSPVGAEEMPRWLRMARLVRVSLEGNGSLCRGLLRVRYGIPDPEERTVAP
ncbi:MAG: iron-sulfur cluster assembly protein [Solirubrobacteraceae bacterium]